MRDTLRSTSSLVFGIDFRMVAPYSVSLLRMQNMEVKWSKLSSGCLYRWWTLGKAQPPSPHMSSFIIHARGRSHVKSSSTCLCAYVNCQTVYASTMRLVSITTTRKLALCIFKPPGNFKSFDEKALTFYHSLTHLNWIFHGERVCCQASTKAIYQCSRTCHCNRYMSSFLQNRVKRQARGSRLGFQRRD